MVMLLVDSMNMFEADGLDVCLVLCKDRALSRNVVPLSLCLVPF
jgi:hypothetical protein